MSEHVTNTHQGVTYQLRGIYLSQHTHTNARQRCHK